MQDVVNIESELMKNMISSSISKLLKRKKDIAIDLQLDEFSAENNGEKIKIHIDVKAEMSSKDLKEICKRYNIPKIIPQIMQGIPNIDFVHMIEEWLIKQILKDKIDIKIKDFKCSKKGSGYYVHIKAHAKTTEEKLRKMLRDAELL